MWIYILVIFIIIYATFKEREALGCPVNFLNGEDCDNGNGKAVRSTESNTGDSTPAILDNIDYAADYNTRFVRWRSYLLASFFGTLLLWFIVFQRCPKEWELVCGIIVLFLTFSLLDGFYVFHVYKCVESNIDNSTNILRDRYNNNEYCDPSHENYKVYNPYHNIDYKAPFLV